MKTAIRWSILALAMCGPAFGQATAVHKDTLQDVAFPPPSRHSVLVHTSVDVGGTVLPHTHPGLELGYIESGSATVSIHGRADQHLSAGQSFAVPPQTVHSVKNTGNTPLVIISTYVVDKDKPIASPAP